MELSSVSVALCTYNGARFVRQQLESIVAQTYRPIEIVVCDDRSTDETARVVEEFSRVSPVPVTFVVNPEQLGYRANFMKAARLCIGDLVAFSDQDDIWLPHKLERCAAPFADPCVMLVTHESLICDETGTSTGVKLYESTHNESIKAFGGAQPLYAY